MVSENEGKRGIEQRKEEKLHSRKEKARKKKKSVREIDEGWLKVQDDVVNI